MFEKSSIVSLNLGSHCWFLITSPALNPNPLDVFHLTAKPIISDMKEYAQKIVAALCCMLVVFSTTAQVPFSDEFNGSTLDSRWIIVNPNVTSVVSLTGTGEVLLRASPLNGGSDLWNSTNYRAPRIIQPVDSAGQWYVETKFHVTLTNDYQGVGIIGITSTNYNDLPRILRMIERIFNGQNRLTLGWGACPTQPFTDTVVFMRAYYNNTQVSVSYSQNGISWSAPCTFTQKLYYVGIFSIRQGWDNQFSVYSNARFEYFKFFNYYEFTGSGNWDISSNWKNNIIPPTALPANSEIIINPTGTSECVLNISQTILPGGKITVMPGKNFTVARELRIE